MKNLFVNTLFDKKIVYAANHKNGLNVLKVLIKLQVEIEYIIVHARDKGQLVNEIIATSKLEKKSIIVWDLKNIKTIIKKLTKKESDILFSVNFGYRFPESILTLFDLPINLHTGYLPYNKGACPNVWPIIEKTVAGVTIHKMTEEFDEGPILFQKKVEVQIYDTGESLFNKLLYASVNLVKERFKDIIDGNFVLREHKGGNYHSEENFMELLRIDMNKTYKASQLIDLLRALSFPPYKNIYFEHNNKKIFIDLNLYCKEAT